MTARSGQRVLGPYPQSNGRFRVVEFDAHGNRSSSTFETEAKAERYIELLRASLVQASHTTATALEEYKAHLRTIGMKDGPIKESSLATTVGALNAFFPEPIPLALLSATRCARLYEALRTTPRARTGKPPSADYHRNTLSQAKTFLSWCVTKGWLRGPSPLAGVKGVGKRRPGGLSLGKAGAELRLRDARAWYEEAMFRAGRGDAGAVAALMALLLGMRASEIVGRKVGDIDEDQEPGDLLWIPCAKTQAGRRTLEVPAELAPLIARCCEGKESTHYVFEASRKHEVKLGKPHTRGWIKAQVHRICDLAKVPRQTAHAMRRALGTLGSERGVAGHVIAATLGHASTRITERSYMAPGAKQSGSNRRGFEVLTGGLAKSAG